MKYDKYSSYKIIRNIGNINPAPQLNAQPIRENSITMKYENVLNSNTSDPQIWGPSFWFSLHNGSVRYPIKASNIVAERMKNFILGIPYILPCFECSEHARAHIMNNYANLDDITSGREKLFNFFVDFHNYVNKRYNKKIMSYEDAKKKYTGNAIVKMSYE